MGGRLALVILALLLVSIMPSYSSAKPQKMETTELILPNGDEISEPRGGGPWIDESLFARASNGQDTIRITAITSSIPHLDSWQRKIGAIERQAPANAGEILVQRDPAPTGIDHRTFWVNSSLLPKLSGVTGLIALLDAERNPEPYGIEAPPPSPSTVRSGEIHGANDAWEMGYRGEGIVVAVADTGVDFGHPDLNGTQARVEYNDSNYSGWPLMLDHNSMYQWVLDGDAYPESDSWYANTSVIDYDNDSDGLLDESGFNITGVNLSLSGEYHLGEHPDWRLREKAGGDVPILVVDDKVSGIYQTVWPDIDRDGWFGNETPMRPGEETSGRDTDGDGLWDISAGLVYWVSDGVNGVPYGATYSSRHGYSDRIAGPGNLTLFMLESGSHGTLCASAIAAQGVIDGGRVLGMAPEAKISSIGNHYSGGHSLDAWRFIAEGYDGDPKTPDQPNIGSFSFGYSSVDDSGSDGYSLYLDWLTRVYNSNTTYAVAIGNGGHGFGTTKVPGAAHGVFSVGAFSSRESDSWGQSAPWSNRGPNAVGRMDPDIVSVGWSATGDMPLNNYETANEAWATWGGTSLATPVVAGLLALVEEAWMENLGQHPGSQELRDFVLSTADDRGYEPFIQGGGWMNASRSVRTLEGQNNTWSVSPAQWNTGWFHGKHREANLNSILPGQSQSFDLNFNNPSASSAILNITPVSFQPLEHTVFVWNSIGNGSSGGENNTWDGHQDERPDLLIPIHITGNDSYQLPGNTTQFRARATIQYDAFDPDLDRSSMERVFLQVYRWSDADGDGIFHNDTDSDGMVDESEWNESDELEEVTKWWSHGPQAEVRVGFPLEDARDGIFLGVWRFGDELSGIDPVRIEVDWTAFGLEHDPWVSVREFVSIQPDSNYSVPVEVSVPGDATPGLRQHGILIESTSPSSPNHTRKWTLPVVTNVPWSGPFSILPRDLDGNVSNQTLYTESWISGAMRWSWRPESGDWRFLTVEWGDDLDEDGAIILDVDWEDNPFTDIDVLWLSETAHGYSDEDPDAYGPSTFYIEDRSTNNHAGSGQHNWGTYTGTSRETFVVPATPGTHQMALHTALHGVQSNDNPLNISVGYIAPESSGFRKVVSDWFESSGDESATVVSTMPLPVESASAQGWVRPMSMENQTAFQDDPNDKMSASWWRNITVEEASEINVRMDSYVSADLDLFLFRDDDGDGNFSSGEEVSRSWGSTSSESVSLIDPSDGLYGVAVHGWSVDGDSAGFWIDIEVIAGTSLNVTDFRSLNDSEISSRWPSGSNDLGGSVPSGAVELNLSFQRPSGEGVWIGFIDIVLEGGAKIRLPYSYELVELDPQISFTSPNNLTQTNAKVPLRLHAIDIGIGFNLSEVTWNWPSNNTTFPAESAWGLSTNGTLANLTHLWNGPHNNTDSILLRELWVNSTLPENEGWFHFHAMVSDASGRQSESHLSVSYDETAPDMAIFGVPWISNSKTLEFMVQTEPGSILIVNGEPTPISESGSVNLSFDLEESQMGLSGTSSSSQFYHNGEGNVFSITSSDQAGNTASTSFQVVFDPEAPSDVSLTSLNEQSGYSFGPGEISSPLNFSIGQLVLEIPADTREWCVLTSFQSMVQDSYCEQESTPPIVLNQSTGYPIPGVTEYPRKVTVSSPIDLTGLPEGDLEISVILEDWANNSFEHSWNLTIDSVPPELSWATSPSSGTTLGDHLQNLSWWSSEMVSFSATVDGIAIPNQSGSEGHYGLALNSTGSHEFCVSATDRTEGQQNSNNFHECRTLELPESDYDTAVSGGTQGLVSLDSIEVVIDRHHSQEVRWRSLTTGEEGVIEPGESTLVFSLELVEGLNDFLIEMDSLDSTDSYTISILRDSTPPVLEFSERSYRESPLGVLRTIFGTCEPGLLVSISSPAESRDLICPENGSFEIMITVPEEPGLHRISGQSTDTARNTNSFEISSLKQDWSEWALEDATNNGPMLWWLIFGFAIILSTLIGTAMRISRQ